MKFSIPNQHRSVILGDGTVFSMSDLPAQDVERWVISRKIAVLRGIHHGIISKPEAIARYRLSEEELTSWSIQYERQL